MHHPRHHLHGNITGVSNTHGLPKHVPASPSFRGLARFETASTSPAWPATLASPTSTARRFHHLHCHLWTMANRCRGPCISVIQRSTMVVARLFQVGFPTSHGADGHRKGLRRIPQVRHKGRDTLSHTAPHRSSRYPPTGAMLKAMSTAL